MKYRLLAVVCLSWVSCGVLGSENMPPSAAGAGAGQVPESGGASAIRQLLWSAGNEREISHGTVPMSYRVLNLTDEQFRGIEIICREAKEESSGLYRNAKTGKDGQGSGPENVKAFYDELHKKQEALLQKYTSRANDLLSPKQREVLGQIRALAQQKSQEEKKLSEETRARLQKIQESYERKMSETLTPEQKQRLEELSKEKRTDVRKLP